MKPQTVTYKKGNGDQVTRLDDSNTFLVHCSELQWGELFTPTIFVEGIEGKRTKFDFHKAYKNKEEKVLHVEYRSIDGGVYKLIVHTQ